MSLTVIAPCDTSSHSGLIRLRSSCEKFNVNFKVYGEDRTYQNWRQIKIDVLVDFISSVDTDYVLCTDAHDSWILSEEKIILDKFNSYSCDILISAEKNLFPSSDLYSIDEYPKSSTSLKYACAGGWIGKTPIIKQIIYDMHKCDIITTNDQELWHYFICKKDYNIKLDIFAKIFLPMCGLVDDEITEFPLVFNETGENPCVIHFNGPTDSWMNNFWQKQQELEK